MLLLSQLGYVPWESWAAVWQLWPLLLVALGVDLMIGRRSLLGAFISSVLILILIGAIMLMAFFAQSIPRLTEWIQPAEFRTEHIEYPLGNLASATVFVDLTSAPTDLRALQDTANLIEGDLAYVGESTFDVNTRGDQATVTLDSHYSGRWFESWDFLRRPDYRWDILLSSELLLDLEVDAGSGSCELDLRGLQLEELFLDAGSGSVDLFLPSGEQYVAVIDGGSGSLELHLPEDTDLELAISGGSGGVEIHLPEGAEARVELESGSGSFDNGNRLALVDEDDEHSVWETDGFATAEWTVLLTIDQGSGSIGID
jgi:hypothetical protein